MMRKNLTLLAIIFSLILIASGAFAMVPRVKFPEWNHTSIKITDWDPIKGIVTITVEIEANKIPIEKCYSQPYLQSNFNKLLSKYEKDNIKQGEKAVFTHKLNIKNNTENWLEMDVRAKPNIPGLKLLIRSEHVNDPAMREILEAEADQIKSPVFIGTSMPILTRDDMALCATPELAFTPTFIHENNKYYIWTPIETADSKTTNAAIKLFTDAIKEKDAKKIEATCQNLIKRFDTEKRNIVVKRKVEPEASKRSQADKASPVVNPVKFIIPTKIALEFLKTDLVCMKAILNKNPKELEKAYNEMKPGYPKAFTAFNLYTLYKSLKNTEKAEMYKKEALKENPAWPLLLKQ